MCLSFTIVAGPRQRSHSRVRAPGTDNHILLSQIRDSRNWRATSQYLYPPGTGWSNYTPRYCVPFSSPPTTRRATVEAFGPPPHGMTRALSLSLMLRPTVCRPVYLGIKLLLNWCPRYIIPWHGQHRKHRSSVLVQLLLIKNLLPSNGCYLVSCSLPNNGFIRHIMFEFPLGV
jgi:hypothetical protein